MGREFWDKGSNCQLGPGMNTARVDKNGRNFEYAAGEDPYLGNKLVQPLIKGKVFLGKRKGFKARTSLPTLNTGF